MDSSSIKLVIGLGNPEPKYDNTRHNAGFWFVDRLAQIDHGSWRHDQKLKAQMSNTAWLGHRLLLSKPNTFMNLSGSAVIASLQFYKLDVTQCLIVHDDIDLPPGQIKLKQGGGHGGHNGLRDIIEKLGTNQFLRLRIGVGHPGEAHRVHDYVLTKPSVEDMISIEHAIDKGLSMMSDIIQGNLSKAMQHLHSEQAGK